MFVGFVEDYRYDIEFHRNLARDFLKVLRGDMQQESLKRNEACFQWIVEVTDEFKLSVTQ